MTRPPKKKIYPLTIAILTCFSPTASAALLVYEGFQYGAAGSDQVTDSTDPNYNLLHAQPDGVGGDIDATGLSGTWNDSAGPGGSSDLFLQPGSLAFGGLPTSGNSVTGDTNLNNDIFSRGITADLDGAGELWFTFLADKLQNNFSAAEGGLVIGNQTVGSARITTLGGGGFQGFGIAPTTAGDNWTAYGFNGTSKVEGTDVLTVGVGGGDARLLGGQIQFNVGTGGTDVFNFYAYNSATPGDHTLVETLDINVDETVLNTLNLTRQVSVAYDEIRLATTEAEALGIPEPSTLSLLLLGGIPLIRRRRS